MTQSVPWPERRLLRILLAGVLAAALLLPGGAGHSWAQTAEPLGDRPDVNVADVTAGVAMPEDVVDASLRVEHANGTVLIVTGVVFHEDRITVEAEVSNRHPDGRAVRLAGGNAIVQGARPLTLVDDGDGAYVFSPDPDDDEVTIPAGQSRAVTLLFLGRVDPDARSLLLTTNDGRANPDDVRTEMPEMAADIPLEVDPDAQAVAVERALAAYTRDDDRLPFDHPVLLRSVHPNRTTLTLRHVAFELDRIVAEVQITNRLNLDEPVFFARDVSAFAVFDDDLGNRHYLVADDDDPLGVQPAEAVRARFVFAGGVHPDATTLTLRTNWLADEPLPAGLTTHSRNPAMELAPLVIPW